MKLTVSVVTTLLCCLILEIALRLISPVQTFVSPLASFHRFDPEVGWIGVPNWTAKFKKTDFDVTIRANVEGFRARQSAAQPAAGSPVIAAFGDSFTWGWGVENGKVFTDVMQNELGTNADVRNFGIDAYGTLQELLLFKRCLANGLRPKSVIIMFYQNDYYDNVDHDIRRPWLSVTGTNVVMQNYPTKGRAIGLWTKSVKASYLLSTIAYVFDFAKEKSRIENLQQTTFVDNSVAAGPQQAVDHCLKQFKKTCDEAGIKLYFIYVPSHDDVEKSASQNRMVLKSLCNKNDVRLLDLTDDFRKTAGNRTNVLFFVHDQHWNADGHALAGHLIADAIRKDLWTADKPTQ